LATRPLVGRIYTELLRRLRDRPHLVEATRGGEGIRGVASEQLANLEGAAPPALRLAPMGSEEDRETGDAAQLRTFWGVVLLLHPLPAGLVDADLDQREHLVNEIKRAVIPAALRDEDGDYLTEDLVTWQRVDAQETTAGNGVWQTRVGFVLTSQITESTREFID
jgi:hypothetical protein